MPSAISVSEVGSTPFCKVRPVFLQSDARRAAISVSKVRKLKVEIPFLSFPSSLALALALEDREGLVHIGLLHAPPLGKLHGVQQLSPVAGELRGAVERVDAVALLGEGRPQRTQLNLLDDALLEFGESKVLFFFVLEATAA